MKIAGVGRESERGQTIALMAISLVSLLGIAALAIDVSALYAARNEAQSAAEAGALAGARIFATSSFTTVPNLFSVPDLVCGAGAGSSSAVNKQAVAAAIKNSISNRPATVTNITCNMDNDGNPRVTVTVQQDNLPTFFSRMWSRANTTVSATATAEAYNASGQGVPIEVTGAKPWLLANCNEDDTSTSPNANCAVSGGGHYSYFVNPGTGALVNKESFIGSVVSLTKLNSTANPTADNFYALDFNTPTASCPGGGGSCASDGAYRDDIQCSSPITLRCGQTVGGVSGISVIGATGYGMRTRQATRCLIHSDGDDDFDDGQDIFHFPGSGKVPVRVEKGDNNPNPNIPNGSQNISRTDSIVTVPLFNGNMLCSGGGVCNGTATIVGFMQLGIRRTCNGGCPPGAPTGSNPHLEAIIMNAVGCGANGAGVAAAGTSPIAVRLIHPN
jgi:hypothetical protein